MRPALVWLCLVAGCGTKVANDGGLLPSDAAPGSADAVIGGPFTITTPTTGTTISSNYLTADGTWVGELLFKAQGGEGVDIVEWTIGGVVAGIGISPDYAFNLRFNTPGDVTVDAVARDVNGAEVARYSVMVTVTETSATGCASTLDALGVMWTSGPSTEGILSALTIKLPLNGVSFTAVGELMPRATWVMDCNLAVALWRMTDALRNYGVNAVTDSGIYRYVCADSNVQPPSCPGSTLSIHAMGLAVDLIGFQTTDGTTYSVADDWIRDSLPAGQNTCTVVPMPGTKNELMHSLFCEIVTDGIFKIHLSPNYDMRNHWHFDLTEGGMVVAQ